MPTTNPVPSTDPSDLLFNAGKLDEVVNGTANSFTDRLGASRRTVAGMNADFDAQLADAESDLNVYRADAAASAAETLGYLHTIRATSYGAYASDPATDPLGNPPTVGDEYFNTTSNLLKRWNGTTWQASDINTANLAASSGSSLVGYDGGTVQDVLDAVTGPNGAAYVGYTPAGTGAVSTAVQEALRRSVSVFDFMTAAQVADVRSGAATLDVTAAIQAALDSALTASAPFAIQTKFRGIRLHCPRGRYRMTAGVTGKAGTSIIGDGYESTIFIHEGTSGDVFSFTGVDGGSVDFVELEGFAVAQKQGTTHSSGYAIKIDGNSFGTTPRVRDVYTYGTHDGLYLDWCFPGTIVGVHCFAHAGNGFTTRFNCTSTTFQNCYAGANSGSGFKIAGNYISLVGCASDSNSLDGYEFYYDGGASTGLTMIGCGSEACSRDVVSTDRVGSISIVAPRLLAGASGLSCLKFDGGDAITVISPVMSAQSVNANPCINIANTSGAYPSNVQLLGFSGTTTNYATKINLPDYVFWPGSRSNIGMYENTLRLGGIGAFNRDLQSFQIGTNFPPGSGGSSFAANYVPVATGAFSLAASAHYRPVVNAPTLTLARVIAGPYIEAPAVTAGTVTRHEGLRINDQPAGSSADAALAIGDAAIPVGRWSIFNGSARKSLFAAGIQWGTSSGPQDLFGTGSPEGVVTAAVGSTYRRTDGGAGTSFYVKESGTGNTGWVAK